MGTLQLLLLTLGLSPLSALVARRPQLTPVHSEELLGKWYTLRWVGDLPYSADKETELLPPLLFVRNHHNELELRVNITKFGRCMARTAVLEEFLVPGGFFNSLFSYFISINFLLGKGKQRAIAAYRGLQYNSYYESLQIMGRTLDEDPDALRMFEEFVEWKGLNRTEIVNPPHTDGCVLARGS